MIENEDTGRATEYILDSVAKGQYSATQIAAAFMKMKLGDEIEDIRTEKFFFEKRPFKGGRGGDKNRGFDRNKAGYGKKPGGRSNDKNKSGYGVKGAKGGEKSRGSYGDKNNSRNEKGGFSTKGEKNREKSRFAGGKPRDVRRDGSAVYKRESDFEPRYGGLRIKTKFD